MGWKSVLFYAIVSISSGVLSANAARPANSIDAHELQKEFGRAQDLTLVHKSAELPADGEEKLAHLARSGVLSPSGQPLADIGMDWSTDDVKLPNLPWGQHLFSAVSDRLIAIVFITGGSTVDYHLVLAPRKSGSYCWFHVPPLHPANLRLSVIQQFIRPDRDQTLDNSPKCEPNFVDERTPKLSK